MQLLDPSPSPPSSPASSSPPRRAPTPLLLHLYNTNLRVLEEARRSEPTLEEIGIPEGPSASLYQPEASRDYSDPLVTPEAIRRSVAANTATRAVNRRGLPPPAFTTVSIPPASSGGSSSNSSGSFVNITSVEEEGEGSDNSWQVDLDASSGGGSSDNNSFGWSDSDNGHQEFEVVGAEEANSEGNNSGSLIDIEESGSGSGSDMSERQGRKRSLTGASPPPPGLGGTEPLATVPEGSTSEEGMQAEAGSAQESSMATPTGERSSSASTSRPGGSSNLPMDTSQRTEGDDSGTGTNTEPVSSLSATPSTSERPPLPPRSAEQGSSSNPQPAVSQPPVEASLSPPGQPRLRLISGIESTRRIPPPIPFESLSRPLDLAPPSPSSSDDDDDDDDDSDHPSDMESDLGSVHTADGHSDIVNPRGDESDDDLYHDPRSNFTTSSDPIFPMDDNPDMVPPVIPVPVPPAEGPRYKRTAQEIPRPRTPIMLHETRRPRSPSPEPLLTNIITNPDQRYTTTPATTATQAGGTTGENSRTGGSGNPATGSSGSGTKEEPFDITNPAHVTARRMRAMNNPKFASTWGTSGRSTGNLWDTLDPYPPSGHYHFLTPQKEPDPYRGSDAELAIFLRSFCGPTVKTPPDGDKNVLGYMMARINSPLIEWFGVWDIDLVGKWVLKHQWAGCWIGLDRKKGWYKIPMEHHTGPGTKTTGGRWPGVECLGGEGIRDTVAGRIRHWGEYFEVIRKKELKEWVGAVKEDDEGLKREEEEEKRRQAVREIRDDALERRGLGGGDGNDSSDDDNDQGYIHYDDGDGHTLGSFFGGGQRGDTRGGDGPTDTRPSEEPAGRAAGGASTRSSRLREARIRARSERFLRPIRTSEALNEGSCGVLAEEDTEASTEAPTTAPTSVSGCTEATRERNESHSRTPGTWEAPTEASRLREETIRKETESKAKKKDAKQLDYWEAAKKIIIGDTSASSTGAANEAATTDVATEAASDAPKSTTSNTPKSTSSKAREVVRQWSFGTLERVKKKDRQ
ncbi:hypothetical protein TWF506_005844 [Arthrobotrys conoides]|uniref:Uncharacterized protein n=1 Tax=Arthrobotrys conoides TaxID=74498 RepID=A0AAN8NKF3_9PEZI